MKESTVVWRSLRRSKVVQMEHLLDLGVEWFESVYLGGESRDGSAVVWSRRVGVLIDRSLVDQESGPRFELVKREFDPLIVDCVLDIAL